MIFVTLGTERYPFDRFLQYIDRAVKKHFPEQEVFYQTGSCRYKPVSGTSEKFLPFSHLKSNLEKASIVIAHAGVGSVNLCLSLGKKPIVCPRQKNLGEAINDHQIAYAKYMAKNGYVFMAENEQEMEGAMVLAFKESKKPFTSNSTEKKKLLSFIESILTGENL